MRNSISLALIFIYCSNCFAQSSFGISGSSNWSLWHQQGTRIDKICRFCYNDSLASDVSTKMRRLFDLSAAMHYTIKKDNRLISLEMGINQQGIAVQAENFYETGFMRRRFFINTIHFSALWGRHFYAKHRNFDLTGGLSVLKVFEAKRRGQHLTFINGKGLNPWDDYKEEYQLDFKRRALRNNAIPALALQINVTTPVYKKDNKQIDLLIGGVGSLNTLWSFRWQFDKSSLFWQDANLINLKIGLLGKLVLPKRD